MIYFYTVKLFVLFIAGYKRSDKLDNELSAPNSFMGRIGQSLPRFLIEPSTDKQSNIVKWLSVEVRRDDTEGEEEFPPASAA